MSLLRLPAAASLRHRNFRLYWFTQMVSLMGTAMQATGQSWLVLQLTHSAWQLGVVGALQFLPTLLFSLFSGVFADRWPKRQLLLVTQTVSTLQAFLLWALLVTGTVQVWHVYLLAVVLGLATCLDLPTRSAFTIELVGRDDLPNAVALNSSVTNLARIVGPGLAGLLIAITGVKLLFLLNGLSFLPVLVGLALINQSELFTQAKPANTGQRQNTWQSLGEGLAYVWKTPAVLLVTLVIGLVLLFGANFSVVLPLLATNVLHAGAPGFGLLSAAQGVGALLSALLQTLGNSQATVRRILLGALVFSGLDALLAVSPIYSISLALCVGLGFAENAFGMRAITFLQTASPDHLRGRVSSVYTLFFTGSIPPGYLLAGWLSSVCGVSIGLLICVALCLLTVGVGWLWDKPANPQTIK